MGAYLSKPVTDKEYETGEYSFISFASCSMQGWRTSQEDSHNCIINFDDDMSLFAVYDGHGGSEVAQLCSDKLPQIIKNNDHYRNNNYSEALTESFLSFDESILTPEVQDVLKKLANIDDNNSNDDDEDDDPSLLQEEAMLPLSQLLRKYQLTMPENGSEEEENEEEKKTEESTTSNLIKGEQIKKIQETTEEAPEDDEDEEFVIGEEDEDDDDEEEEDDEENSDDNEETSLATEGMPQDTQYLHSAPGFDSGSTAVVALIDRRNMRVYVANAGDSRCVLCREGHAVDLSIDHKPEDELESERITRAGGVLSEDGRVNGGLNLSRSLGDHSYKRNKEISPREQMISALPDVRTHDLDLQRDEFIVLACDGIWNSFSSEELVEFVRKRLPGGDLKTVIAEIFAHCLAPNTCGDGTGCDNMTCIIATFKSPDLCNGNAAKRRQPTEAPQESKPPKIIKT